MATRSTAPSAGASRTRRYADEHARQLRGLRREPQSILQNDDREQPEQRPRDAAASAENGSPAQHYRRDGDQLIAAAGVGLGLSQMRNIDHRRQAGRQTGQGIDQRQALCHRDTGIARPFRRESDRRERSSDGASVDKYPIRGRHRHQDKQLRRYDAADVALPQEQKARWKAGVVDGASGEALGDAAKQRICAKSDDQRSDAEPRDEQRVQSAAEYADRQRKQNAQSGRQPTIVPQRSEADGAESHHRSNREVDAARQQNRRQRQREKP